MSWVDVILNIAGLLMWLNWRAGKFDPVAKRAPVTLVGTLRSTQSVQIQKFQRWSLPVFLGALLFFRAVLYYLIGPALRWSGGLNLGVISLSFRSDLFWSRILPFSVLSFAVTLGIFYSWLILFSILKGPKPVHDFVRIQLGRIDGWPLWVKFTLPFAVTAIAWWLLSWALVGLGVMPPPHSEVQRLEESFIIALQAYLIWKFPLVLLLLVRLLNSYIYFGSHPVWNYADVTGEKLLQPLRKIPLRIGKADFAPIIGIALVLLVAEFAGRGLSKILFKA